MAHAHPHLYIFLVTFHFYLSSFHAFSAANKSFHCLTLRGNPHFGEKEAIMRVEKEGNATRGGQGSGKHSLFVVELKPQLFCCLSFFNIENYL